MREADVGSQSADSIKLSFTLCSNRLEAKASPGHVQVADVLRVTGSLGQNAPRGPCPSERQRFRISERRITYLAERNRAARVTDCDYANVVHRSG